MNGRFNHVSARYDFAFVYNIIYLSFKEGVGVGSGDTTVDEVLACHQCSLGSSTGVDAISTWVESAAGFLPFSGRFLSGSPVFPSPQKIVTPKFPYSHLLGNYTDHPLVFAGIYYHSIDLVPGIC